MFGHKKAFMQTQLSQNQHLWCQNGDTMSPGNQGVFQLLKEVTFRKILAFCNLWEGCLSCASYWLVGLVRKKWNYDCFDDQRYNEVDDVEVLAHNVCFVLLQGI